MTPNTPAPAVPPDHPMSDAERLRQHVAELRSDGYLCTKCGKAYHGNSPTHDGCGYWAHKLPEVPCRMELADAIEQLMGVDTPPGDGNLHARDASQAGDDAAVVAELQAAIRDTTVEDNYATGSREHWLFQQGVGVMRQEAGRIIASHPALRCLATASADLAAARAEVEKARLAVKVADALVAAQAAEDDWMSDSTNDITIDATMHAKRRTLEKVLAAYRAGAAPAKPADADREEARK